MGPNKGRLLADRQNQESTLGILREITRLPEAINLLSFRLAELAKSQREHGPAEERLEELERSRSIWEAECEAELLKATSKYRAATAAETRTRKMNEKADPFDDQGDEVQEGIPPEYAAPSEGEGVLPLREDLAVLDVKQQALRMKFS